MSPRGGGGGLKCFLDFLFKILLTSCQKLFKLFTLYSSRLAFSPVDGVWEWTVLRVSRFFVFFFVVSVVSCFVVEAASGVSVGEAVSLDFSVVGDAVDLDAVKEHVLFFESLGSRVSGYPGCDLAAEYIQQFLMEYCSNVFVDEFYVVVSYDYGATLFVSSPTELSFTVYSFLPNHVSPS